MLVKEYEYVGQKAIKMENDEVRAIILPRLGGKIASLFHKGKKFELLYQNPQGLYRKPQLYSDFAQFDASGCDDAFPTIDPCTVQIDGGLVNYPDHGEIWSAEFETELKLEGVLLKFKSSIFGYEYLKEITLLENGLNIRYKILNKKKGTRIPVLWAFHCLVNCEENMELHFPPSTKQVLNVKDSKYLGGVGKVHDYPVTYDLTGKPYRLDRVFPRYANKTEKYYVQGSVQEGECGMYFPTHQLFFRLEFDQEQLPYLGFWVTEGGFRGDYNCAFEPCNGFYDSIDIAKEKGALFMLEDELSFELFLKLEDK